MSRHPPTDRPTPLLFLTNPLPLTQQIELSPTYPRRVLTFNTDRKWVSVDNPEVYLPQYAEYQMRKYDPPVFAMEVDNSKTRELQRRRRLYFVTRGRLGRLAVLENVKDWPYKFGIPTRVSYFPRLYKPLLLTWPGAFHPLLGTHSY